MALVTVTGDAWTHSGAVIPSSRRPELWFRPSGHNLGDDALLLGTEVKATLNTSTGAFSVQLDNTPGARYRPVMRWLTDPDADTGDPQQWAWQYAEWPFEVVPVTGGSISEVADQDLSIYNVLVSVTLPAGYHGWWLSAGPGDPDDPAQTGTGELSWVA